MPSIGQLLVVELRCRLYPGSRLPIGFLNSQMQPVSFFFRNLIIRFGIITDHKTVNAIAMCRRARARLSRSNVRRILFIVVDFDVRGFSTFFQKIGDKQIRKNIGCWLNCIFSRKMLIRDSLNSLCSNPRENGAI